MELVENSILHVLLRTAWAVIFHLLYMNYGMQLQEASFRSEIHNFQGNADSISFVFEKETADEINS